MAHRQEQRTWLAFFPVVATCVFYFLPESLQIQTFVQFLPQLVGYLGLAFWIGYNTSITQRLGLSTVLTAKGIRLGAVIGVVLGACNSIVILWAAPEMGYDIAFLKETPHAKVPIIMMVPWLIIAIAIGVELNFRGFILGRLMTLANTGKLGHREAKSRRWSWESRAAIGCSALVFAFDPFLVNTFKHLHWIAVWDGVIWGWMFSKTRTLYATITAHAVEVVIMYLCVKTVLT